MCGPSYRRPAVVCNSAYKHEKKLASVRRDLKPSLKIKEFCVHSLNVHLLPLSQMPLTIYETELKLLHFTEESII